MPRLVTDPDLIAQLEEMRAKHMADGDQSSWFDPNPNNSQDPTHMGPRIPANLVQRLLGGSSPMTPNAIAAQRDYARTLMQPTPMLPGQFARYGPLNAIADVFRGGLGGYEMGQAANAERANYNTAASSFPSLGDYGGAPASATAQALSPFQPSPVPTDALAAGTSGDTLGYIKAKEGFSATPYPDGAQTSIGWGTKAYPGETSISPEEADRRMRIETGRIQTYLANNVKVPLAPSQVASLTSFGYNLGTGKGGLADIVPYVNKGDFQSAAALMQHYNRFNGQPNDGLIQRRSEEGRMLLHPLVTQGQQYTDRLSPTGQNIPGGNPMPMTMAAYQAQQGAPGQSAPQAPQWGGAAMASQQQAQPGAPVAPGGPQQPGVGPASGVLPQLPRDEDIHNMMRSALMTGNSQLMETARQLYAQKWQALQPQTIKTPDGRTLIGSPYTGWKDSGLPAMPTIERYPYEVGGIKGESPLAPTYENGQFGYRQVPISGPGGQPLNQGAPSQTTGTSGAAYEPFPTNGSIADKAAWAERQQGRLEATKTAAKSSGEIQGQIDADAGNALFLKRNIAEMRNLAQNINPNSLADYKRVVGNTLQGLGFSNEAVSQWLGTNPGDVEAFRKASATLGAELTHTYFPRPAQQEFKLLLDRATPSEMMTPQGLGRVLDFSEKAANQALDKQAEFQSWKQGRSPDTLNDFNAYWNGKQRDLIERGGLTSSPGSVGGPARTGYQPSEAQSETAIGGKASLGGRSAPAVPPVQDGTVIRNPATGERRIMRGGQWQTLQ